MPTDIQASLMQISQLGVEVTPGTPVAATRRLTSMGIPMTPGQNIQNFSPRGSKFDTASALVQEWSEGTISDGSGLAYNEIQYILASILSKPSAPAAQAPVAWSAGAKPVGFTVYENNGTANHVFRVTATDGTDATEPTWAGVAIGGTVTHEGVTWINDGPPDVANAYLWTFDIATYARDVVQTYTIETGDLLSGRSYRAAYCYFTGMSIESARADVITLGGDLVGHARSPFDLTTIGGGEPELIPATPAHLNIYMDDDSTELGTTLLDGNFSVNLGIADRAAQVWFHRRDLAGPAGRVETKPAVTAELIQADGEEVDEMLVGLRNSTKKFFRFEWVGPEIVPGRTNKLIWDMAANIGDTSSYDDQDGVWAVTIPFTAQHDADWGKAMQVKLTNSMSGL